MKYATDIMQAGRILSHGKIESLDADFSLPNNVPFSIFLVPKEIESAYIGGLKLLKCKLYHDTKTSECPILVGCWNEPSIVTLSANAPLLDDYDVFWGAGNEVEEE